jgi:hypothetical protein
LSNGREIRARQPVSIELREIPPGGGIECVVVGDVVVRRDLFFALCWRSSEQKVCVLTTPGAVLVTCLSDEESWKEYCRTGGAKPAVATA